MQILTSDVEDLYQHLFHPIGEQIIAKMLTGFNLKKVFGNRVHLKSDVSSSSRSSGEDNSPTLEDNRVTVAMTPNFNPQEVKWATTTFQHGIHGVNSIHDRQGRRVIFHDEEIQTTIVEREVPANLLLEFTMQFTDRVAAHAAVSKIQTTYTDGDKMLLTDVMYEYPLPLSMYVRLYGFFKQLKGGTPEDFLQYLSDFSGTRVSTNINRHAPDTSEKQIVVKRNLSNVLAQIDFNVDKPVREGTGQSTDKFILEFSVVVQFSRCNLMVMMFPIHMMNQQVPGDLLVPDMSLQYADPSTEHPFFAQDKFLKLLANEAPEPPPKPVMIPWYDSWIVPTKSALPVMEYQPFVSIAITLDDIENPTGETVIDLEDLPVTLAPTIIEILKAQGNGSLYFDRPVNVSVYANDVAMEPNELTLDGGTILRIARRDVYPVYRLLISEYIGAPNGNLTTFRVLAATIIASQQ